MPCQQMHDKRNREAPLCSNMDDRIANLILGDYF